MFKSTKMPDLDLTDLYLSKVLSLKKCFNISVLKAEMSTLSKNLKFKCTPSKLHLVHHKDNNQSLSNYKYYYCQWASFPAQYQNHDFFC